MSFTDDCQDTISQADTGPATNAASRDGGPFPSRPDISAQAPQLGTATEALSDPARRERARLLLLSLATAEIDGRREDAERLRTETAAAMHAAGIASEFQCRTVELDTYRGVPEFLAYAMRHTVVATCSCCGTEWDGLAWSRLRPVGIQRTEDPAVSFELRVCTCGSTRAARMPTAKGEANG